MPIVVYGISHKTADLDTREQLANLVENIPQVISQLKSKVTHVKEAILLSTCQRVEYYLYMDDACESDLSYLQNHLFLPASYWKPYLYSLEGRAALVHMMKVANGLDSSLLGEPQILGQLKKAYHLAKLNGFLGKHLEQIMQFIFATAKKIRSYTAIGQGPLSLSNTAMNLGKCIFSELPNPYVLLIGAGAVVQSMLNHLVKKAHLTLVIANRSYEKAVKLAEQYQATAVPLSEIYEQVALSDIVISATSSSSLILEREKIQEALISRKEAKALFMMDMAVPRDISPEVSELKDVFLYNVDDLHKIIQKHLDAKQQAASTAAVMIEEEVDRLVEKIRMNKLSVLIHSFRYQVGLIREQLLEKALFELENKRCAQAVISDVLFKIEAWVKQSFEAVETLDVALRKSVLMKAAHQLNLGKKPFPVLQETSRWFMNQLLHKPTLAFKYKAVK